MTVKLLSSFVSLVIIYNLVESKFILEQVVILNRHGLRAPLSKTLDILSPKIWPKWEGKPGIMTAKGKNLVGYMGSYVSDWLKQEGVLPLSCPTEDDLYVICNTLERTLTSAQLFVEKGFPDCRINIHYTEGNTSNPLFNPIIHNTSTTFHQRALEEMQKVLSTLSDLNESYELLSNILEFQKSKFCEIYGKCNLAQDENQVSITSGSRPRLVGPLKIADEIVDTFLMQNYEGFSANDVAWGLLNDINSWEIITELDRAYYNVTYKTKLVAKDLSEPLIKFISNTFLKEDNKPKVTLLVGHDANFYTVFETLQVKPYKLDKQFEVTPIGGAVVFQKWKDDVLKKKYLKISFLYQSTEQMRNNIVLSLKMPPQIKVLELEKCKVDEEGFCSWDDFKILLDSI